MSCLDRTLQSKSGHRCTTNLPLFITDAVNIMCQCNSHFIVHFCVRYVGPLSARTPMLKDASLGTCSHFRYLMKESWFKYHSIFTVGQNTNVFSSMLSEKTKLLTSDRATGDKQHRGRQAVASKARSIICKLLVTSVRDSVCLTSS